MSCEHCNHWFGKTIKIKNGKIIRMCYKRMMPAREDEKCKYDTSGEKHRNRINKSEKFI